MSIIKSFSLKNAVAAASDKPMLAPEQVLEQLRALREQIPEFVQLPRTDVVQIRREANVNIDFARVAITAVGTSELMQSAIGNTPEDLHHAEDELARWTIVENEFRSMLRGIIMANLIRRHRIGRVVVHAYNIARQLVQDESHAQLLPLVETMSRMRKFIRRRVKPPAEPAPPAPQPQQQQTARTA